MYFENRYSAGQNLAKRLTMYSQDTVILCLGDGAVLVAEPIAKEIKAPVLLLVMKDIAIPGGDNAPVVGTVDQGGGFTYNSTLSKGEVFEFEGEYHGHLEQEKMQQMHEIHQMISHQGDISRDYLNDKTIILVSDGLQTGTVIDAAVAFLKPVRVNKIVAAVPFASVPAVDKLHTKTDEIVCLDTKENYLATEHYYEDNEIPSREEIQHRLELLQTYM